MTLTILVYLWISFSKLFLWMIWGSVAGGVISFIALIGIEENCDQESFFKWVKRLFGTVLAVFLAGVVGHVLTPSKNELAILIATYTASTVVQSTEAQKAMELLRLYVGKELDAEIAKLKKHD